MKNSKKNVLLAFVSTALILLGSCSDSGGDEPAELTDAEKLSRTWLISEAYENGSRASLYEGGSFRITLNAADGQPTTYSVTPQSGVPRPDFNNEGSNSGQWTLTSNNRVITFNHSSGLTSSVNLVGGSISEERAEIEWSLPDPDTDNPGGDKTNPTYRFVLLPAN